ncbi:hypothetical protein GCM10020256_15290 [Streptomyces thermocoprophilus]
MPAVEQPVHELALHALPADHDVVGLGVEGVGEADDEIGVVLVEQVAPHHHDVHPQPAQGVPQQHIAVLLAQPGVDAGQRGGGLRVVGPLPRRQFGDRQGEVPAAERAVRLDQGAQRALPQPDEPAYRDRGEVLVADLGQRGAAPQRQRLVQQPDRGGGRRAQRLADEPGELGAVQFAGVEGEPVGALGAARGGQLPGGDDPRALPGSGEVEGAPQLQDAFLHLVAVALVLARQLHGLLPHVPVQLPRGDRLALGGDQAQQQAGGERGEPYGGTVHVQQDGSEDTQADDRRPGLHAPRPLRRVTSRQQCGQSTKMAYGGNMRSVDAGGTDAAVVAVAAAVRGQCARGFRRGVGGGAVRGAVVPGHGVAATAGAGRVGGAVSGVGCGAGPAAGLGAAGVLPAGYDGGRRGG